MKRKNIIIISIITFLIIFLIIFFSINKKEDKIVLSEYDKNVKIVNDEINKNIKRIVVEQEEIHTEKIQNSIEKNIKYELQNGNYTFKNPLVIIDPYKTNCLAINIYFKTNKYNRLKYTIKSSKIKEFTNIAKQNKVIDNIYGYQITGIVLNKDNIINLELKNKLGFYKKNSINIKLNDNEKIANKNLEIVKDSKKKLENGLFLINTRVEPTNKNMKFYDNNGILRACLFSKCDTQFRAIFRNNSIIYPIDKSNFIEISSLGKIKKIYNIGNYFVHHNYTYDEYNDKLLLLSDNRQDKYDRGKSIIELDLKSAKYKKIIDLKDLLPEMYKQAEANKEITYQIQKRNLQDVKNARIDKNVINWAHINSVTQINENDVLISSRELSTILYVENIYKKPKLKYLIAEPEVFKGTSYESLLLKKESKFTSQAGQHSLIYESNSKDKNKYYITMYNNSAPGAITRPYFNWTSYEDLGSTHNPKESYVYVYEVNEKEKTYDLKKHFPVRYSSTQGNVHIINNNYIVTTTYDQMFSEYDKDGKLLKEFKYITNNKRGQLAAVYKYDMKDFWFEK